MGIDLFEDCICVNAVNCRPTDASGANRAPTKREIACCRPRVLSAVFRFRPRVIVLHGTEAVVSLLAHRWQGNLGGITRWRGWTIPDRDLNAWVCPTFHPAYVMRAEGEYGEAYIIFEQDLKRAFSLVNKPLPRFCDEEKQVEIVEDVREVRKLLWALNRTEGFLAFDIETTGLRPYDPQQEIVCISFCRSWKRAYVIPALKDRKTVFLLRQLLENPRIGKIAANMKFEETWMIIKYGIRPSPWAFDVMLAAHVLDNRQGVTGLKFQAYVNFGLLGYDKEVAPYLKSNETSTLNRVPQMMENPELRKKLMMYCGVDSLVTYRLAMKQMKELGVYGRN